MEKLVLWDEEVTTSPFPILMTPRLLTTQGLSAKAEETLQKNSFRMLQQHQMNGIMECSHALLKQDIKPQL